MKSFLKPLTLAALVVASIGLITFTGGCAATSTSASTGEFVDDSSITLKVKSAFVRDPAVSAMKVSVETFKGVVQLSGFVNTAEEKAQAGRVAAAVKGVTDVKNNIVIK